MAFGVTLFIFLLMIVGIIKKIDLRCMLLGEICLILIYLTVTGGSVLKDSSTGNCVIDGFAYISEYLSSNIGGIALSIIIVFAYVEVMNKIGAARMLAYIIAIPLKKVKNTYILAAVVVAVGCLLRTVIAAGPAEVALMIGTFMPILLACGCSLGTTAVAMAVYNIWCFGPADPTVLAAANIMGIEVKPAEWFIKVQFPIVLFMLVVVLLVYMVTSVFFDKKENHKNNSEALALECPDVPMIYALLPILPLVFMLLFSPFLIASVSMDINTACLISLAVTLLLTLIVSKGKESAVKILQSFFDAFGDNLKNLGLIIILAMCFAASLNMVGGMNVIADLLASLQVTPVILVLLICSVTSIITIIVGSFFGALAISIPLAASMCTSTGLEPSTLCFLIVTAVGVGCACSPINPAILVASSKCQISAGALIKRIAPIAWIAMIAGAVFTTIVF